MKNYVRNILIFVVTFSLIFCLAIIPSYADSSFSYLLDNGWTFWTNNDVTFDPNTGLINVTSNTRTFFSFIPPEDFDETTEDLFSFTATVKSISTTGKFRISTANGAKFYFTNLSNNLAPYPDDGRIYFCTALNNSVVGDTYSVTVNSDMSASNGTDIHFDFYNSGATVFQGTIELSNITYGNSDITPIIHGSTTLQIPRGSVAYIGVPDDGISFKASTTFPVKSDFFSGGWDDSPQRYDYSSSLPSTGLTFDKSFGSRFPFTKTDPFDVFRQSFNATMNYPITIGALSASQKYLVIYNPFYYGETLNIGVNSHDNVSVNNVLYCWVSQYTDVKLYKLQQEVQSNGNITSISPSNFTQDYTGEITDNEDGTSTVVFTPSSSDMPEDPNEDTYNTSGGGLRSITEYLNDIKETLSEFANSFISLLQAPISHVRQLISAGSEYFGVIRDLYAWLPDEVQGTINSAMIVSFSVGVIALLL